MKKFLVYTFIAIALSLLTVAAVLAQGPDDAQLSGEQCKACHAEEYDEWAATVHPKSKEQLSKACLKIQNTHFFEAKSQPTTAGPIRKIRDFITSIT